MSDNSDKLEKCEQRVVHSGCGGVIGDNYVCTKCNTMPPPQNRTVADFCPHGVPFTDGMNFCVVCLEGCGFP